MKNWTALFILVVIATAGCNVNSALEQLSEARHLSADLLVEFTRAAGAANRAVMADTDQASVAFASDAEQAKQAIQKKTDALKPLLQSLGYTEEMRLLEDFGRGFAEYRALARTILELAVENTNLKAQRLSFGSAQEAADAFRDALTAVAPRDAATDVWHVRALVATAVASVREIQVLQAPHIAEPDDEVMARLEKRIAASEAAARSALETLTPLVQTASRPRLTTATGALDRFMGLNAQIIALSRRNTNVRSLALSLNEKEKLTATCEERLVALRDALAKRGVTGKRYPL